MIFQFRVSEEESKRINMNWHKDGFHSRSKYLHYYITSPEVVAMNFEKVQQSNEKINAVGQKLNDTARRVNQQQSVTLADMNEALRYGTEVIGHLKDINKVVNEEIERILE